MTNSKKIVYFKRNLITIAKNLINHSTVCVFSTIGIEGAPRSRYMGTFLVSDKFRIYLVCLSNSNKVKEIIHNKKAQLLFASRDFKRIITLTGYAYLVTNYKKRKNIYDKIPPLELYKEFNDKFGVIKFSSNFLEYLDLNIRKDPIKIAID